MTTAPAVSGGGQELYELLQLLEIVAWACKAMQNHHDGAGGGQLMVALQQTGGKGRCSGCTKIDGNRITVNRFYSCTGPIG